MPCSFQRQWRGSQQLCYLVGDELASGVLLEVLAPKRPAPMPVYAVLPSARLLPPRVRVLLDAPLALPERAAG